MAALFLVMAACSSDDDDEGAVDAGDDTGEDGGGAPDVDSELLAAAIDQGFIRVGIANERPYGFEDESGRVTGEAPEVARAVLSRLGVDDIQAEVVDFGALIDGLNAGRFDMIAAGMFINEERAANALFTDPDYCGTNAFAVEEGNPEGLSDIQSVIDSGATVAVLAGAVEEGYLVDSDVPDGQISRFDTTADMVDALTAGRVDAFFLTAITVREQVADIDGYEATEGFVPVVGGEEQLGCGGYVFRFDNKPFRDAFNDVLNEMKESGEILPIVEEFGFTSAEIDAAKGVTVEDLIGQPYDFGIG